MFPSDLTYTSTMAPLLTGQEVAEHNTRESCWIIVHGKAPTFMNTKPKTHSHAEWLVGNVYDVTEFLDGLWFKQGLVALKTTSHSSLASPSHLSCGPRLQTTPVSERITPWTTDQFRTHAGSGGSKIILKYAGKDAT